MNLSHKNTSSFVLALIAIVGLSWGTASFWPEGSNTNQIETQKKTELKTQEIRKNTEKKKIEVFSAPEKKSKIQETKTADPLQTEFQAIHQKLKDMDYIHRLNNDSTPKEERQHIQKLMVKREKIRKQIVFARLRKLENGDFK